MAQGIGPEFKPQYQTKKKKKIPVLPTTKKPRILTPTSGFKIMFKELGDNNPF
jgi:hypothetical protein